MKDEEIVELSKLKDDRDRIRHLHEDTKDIDRVDVEDHERTGFKNFINQFVRTKSNIKSKVFNSSGYMGRIEFRTDQFNNETVQARIRQIQAAAHKLIATELDKLDNEISKALESYDGRPIKDMMVLVRSKT